MNREIKFRAWDGEKIIYEDKDGFFINVKHPMYAHSQTMQLHNTMQVCDVMQYTGLKDRNGVEIYEGDIVKFYNPYSLIWFTMICKYDYDFACFALFANNSKTYADESDWVKIQQIEVIGNQFEHPELLK